MIRGFVERHPDPFDRRLAEGHLTAAAFVLDPGGRVLLTHHRRLGKWLQLGGHAEPGERRAEQVALREAREESGLEGLAWHPALCGEDTGPQLLDVDVHCIPAGRGEPEHLHLDLRFLIASPAGQTPRAASSEAHAVEWVDLDEAERRCEPGLGRAFGKIRRLLAARPAR